MEEYRQLKPLNKGGKICRTLRIIAIILSISILTSIYLRVAGHRYEEMAETKAEQLAQSVGALLHVEHIESLVEGNESPNDHLVDQSLIDLVEATDSISYAYLLKYQNDNITVISDSSRGDTYESQPDRRSCEETVEANKQVFNTGESLVTGSIATACGTSIRVLVPIYDGDHNIISVLGLSYSTDQWHDNLRANIVLDIIVLVCLILLIITVFNLIQKNSKYKAAEESRLESERSKSVYLSQLPGMAYRSKDNYNWTMEFVSEGCYELTGYQVEDLINDAKITYNDIISPEFRDLSHAEWDRVLMNREQYRDEYEIITKTGERKWVLELGQGIYDEDGNVEALEGIIQDISAHKKQNLQILHLRERDYLTGLYNRNYMQEELKRLDQEEFWPLSVMICDIDGLRVINNAYGHEEGDYLIIKTSQLINNILRDDYVFGHNCGGEFMILMPNTDIDACDKLKSHIKKVIRGYNRNNKKALYNISITMGYSSKANKEQEIQAVTKEADENLRRRKMVNQNSSHSDIVSSIMATLYAKSQETEEHGQRLWELCLIIGDQLDLSQSELDDLQLLSKLHDIGKIGIGDYILNKPSKLSKEEWAIMKKHPEIGKQIVMTTPQLEHIADYILYHHERWDGTGYPKGLEGEAIPLASRILSIADAYDAMTNHRVYQEALSKEDAIREIEDNAGSQFDPYLSKLFVKILKEDKNNNT